MNAMAFRTGCQIGPHGNEGDGPLPIETFGAFPSPSCSPYHHWERNREADAFNGPLPVETFGAFPSLVLPGRDWVRRHEFGELRMHR